MKIRTQLVIAFLVLAVVPLTAIVVYSYLTSIDAVRKASQQEAATMTAEMDQRMRQVRGEIETRIAAAAWLPSVTADLAGTAGADRLVEYFGDSARLIDQIDITPAAPEATPSPQPPAVPAPPAPPAPLASAAAEPADGGKMVIAVPAMPEPITIDFQQMLRELEHERTMGREEAIATAAEVEAALEQAKAGLAEASAALSRNQAPGVGTEIGMNAVKIAESVVAAQMKAAEKVRVKVARKVAESAAGRSEIEQQTARATEHGKRMEFHRLHVPIVQDGWEVARVEAKISPEKLLRKVLGYSERETGEVPFAIDRDGKLYTLEEKDRQRLMAVAPVETLRQAAGSRPVSDDWIVVTSQEEQSGLAFGIAKPMREPLAEVRRTAARNFGYGLGLIVLALIGIVPIANHMTRDVKLVTAGAERIAAGDLETAVEVRSRNEFGQLAAAFNRMATDLRTNQARLLDEERLRKEQEIRQRLLSAEYERKSAELEEARQFQLSLLPKAIPQSEEWSIGVFMRTATEVGGDYYDFNHDDGSLAIAIGDATGHGARAGTMVTIVKSLFSTYSTSMEPSSFLDSASQTIRRMDLGRMAMALTLARYLKGRLSVATGGMPPALLYRAALDRVDELSSPGMPLGTMAQQYRQIDVEVEPGDTLLLTSDGFPELLNGAGEPLGYAAVQTHFETAARHAPEQIIAQLQRAAEEWGGEGAPGDDITFVVVKFGKGSS